MALQASAGIVTVEWLRVAVTPDTLGTLSAGVSASALTLTLDPGYESLPKGVQPILIDSELMLATQSGDTLTVETGSRGYFGSTAAAHLASATVSVANLSSIIGTSAYRFASPEGYKNATPAVIVSVVGGSPNVLSGDSVNKAIRQPALQFICYGGKDAAGNYPDLAADFVHRALSERMLSIVASTGETVASGRVISIVEDGEGQIIYDEDTNPKWPKILTFASAQII